MERNGVNGYWCNETVFLSRFLCNYADVCFSKYIMHGIFKMFFSFDFLFFFDNFARLNSKYSETT